MVTFAGGSAVTVDARAKANLKTYLSKLKEAKDDLEHIHKVNEEERERMSSRRQVSNYYSLNYVIRPSIAKNCLPLKS